MTDAELMEKAFMPVFNAEDLHKQGNYRAIATVMMFNLPSSPFTMSLLPPMGEPSAELMESMKMYVAAKYGRTRAEVEQEIKARWNTPRKNGEEEKKAAENAAQKTTGGFLESWKKKREKLASQSAEGVQEAAEVVGEDEIEVLQPAKSEAEANKGEETVFKVRQ